MTITLLDAKRQGRWSALSVALLVVFDCYVKNPIRDFLCAALVPILRADIPFYPRFPDI